MKSNILIVEDDPILRDLIYFLFEYDDVLHVQLATDEYMAMRAMDEQRFDRLYVLRRPQPRLGGVGALGLLQQMAGRERNDGHRRRDHDAVLSFHECAPRSRADSR